MDNLGIGLIGDGTKEGRLAPVQIGTDYIAVSAGDRHSLAVKSDGSLWGWGSNQYDQLGLGTFIINEYEPTLIGPK